MGLWDWVRNRAASFLQLEQKRAIVTDFGSSPGLMSGLPYRSAWTAFKAIREGLQSSSTVYACCRKITTAAGSVPWLVEVQDRKGQWEVNTKHPLNMLWGSPNPFMSTSDLVKRMVMHMLLAGNCLVIKHRSDEGIPLELWPANPDTLFVVPDAIEYILEYRVSPSVQAFGHLPSGYSPRDILHVQLDPDPANPYWGLSPIETGANAIDTESRAVKWNRNAMEHRTLPDGILSFKRDLSIDAYKLIRSEIDNRGGSEHARRFLIIGSEASFAPGPQTSAVDLDFIEGRRLTRDEICGIFGVPSVLIATSEGTAFANQKEARKLFWQETVIPLLIQMQEAINRSIAAEWGEDVRIRFDASKVPAMRDVLADSVPLIDALARQGVPFKTINAVLQLNIPSFPGDETGYLAAGLVPTAAMGYDPQGGVPPATGTPEQPASIGGAAAKLLTALGSN